MREIEYDGPHPKSRIAREIAEELGIEVIDIKLPKGD